MFLKSGRIRIPPGGTEAEIQLLLKRYPDSSVSSLIQIGWGEEGHPATKNLLQYPWVDNWLMAIFPLVVELTLVKCHQRFGCLLWGPQCGANILPQLSMEESDVFKINDDDDDDDDGY